MKIFGIIAGILILLIVGAGCLFFSDFGNNLAKPCRMATILAKSAVKNRLIFRYSSSHYDKKYNKNVD